MRFITQIEDDTVFLSRLYDTAEFVNQFIDTTGIIETIKKKPQLEYMGELPKDFKEYSVDKQAEIMKKRAEIASKNQTAIMEQVKKNLMEILMQVCKTNNDMFVELMHKVIVLDEGEEYPHGIALLTAGISAFTCKEMLDFFTQLTVLGTITSAQQ